MNQKPLEEANDPDLRGACKAMQRAALRAKEIAALTGTPVVTWENGKIHHDYPKLSEVAAIRLEIEKLKN